jgi:outer membrane protein OmpA-like peptidoglycan-associated protein
MFTIRKNLSILILFVYFATSCSLISDFSTKKYNANTSKSSMSRAENPRYYDNGGKIKTNILNKRRVEKERNIIQLEKTYKAAKAILEKQKNSLENIETTHKIDKVEQIRRECEIRINKLYEELKLLDPNTKDGYKRSLEMLTEINDLFANRIQPLEMIISKNIEVKELQGDFSFKTGSFKLTDQGIKDIEKFIQSIENDILIWKKYVNNYNQQLFSNEKFKLMVVIDGYADKQGSDAANLVLSENRAEEVRNEFIKRLSILSKKHKVVFDVKYFGKGETLPPGITDNGMETDSRRRICRIMSVVGPSSYME